ncbi:MAG: peptidase C1 [Acidobacteria bacterium]|nr:peptidase C1 [Acidobacteriota bacterium]
MRKLFSITIIILLVISVFLVADDKKKDEAVYKLKAKYPVLAKIENNYKAMQEKADAVTDAILKKIAEEKKAKKLKSTVLRFDVSGIIKPTELEDFKSEFHFPPVAQYYTGTCWSYSATSFFETEIYRLHEKKIKLSEMFTAYWEYVEKAKGFFNTRGNSEFEQGSESDAVVRVWKKYGAVPYDVYDGILAEDGLHYHNPMRDEIFSFLNWCKDNNYWDEELIVETVKNILNKTMGAPPEEFMWNGKKYTPKSFLENEMQLNLDDYIQFQSTLSLPFYTQGVFDVPDNWWFSDEYYNIPLDDFINVINKAIENGYTLTIGGDVSEPGYNGWEEVQVVPSFDVPAEYINQSSREYRIYAGITEDDHGIHLIGYTKLDGHYWYLIKDSARSARQGKHKGYQFYRDDYVKLKMLTIGMHKDAAKDILAKIAKNKPAEKELKLEVDGPSIK